MEKNPKGAPVYESVDHKSLSWVISQKPTKKEFMQQSVTIYIYIYKIDMDHENIS